MQHYGLDEANLLIPPQRLQTAFHVAIASDHGVITQASTLNELLTDHGFVTQTRDRDGALIVTDFQDTKEWSGTRNLFEAIALYVDPVEGSEAYLVWGCADFVDRWYFKDGQLVSEYTDLTEEEINEE